MLTIFVGIIAGYIVLRVLLAVIIVIAAVFES